MRLTAKKVCTACSRASYKEIMYSMFEGKLQRKYVQHVRGQVTKKVCTACSRASYKTVQLTHLNPLNAQLKPIYHLVALLEAHYILHVNRIRVNKYFYSDKVDIKVNISNSSEQFQINAAAVCVLIAAAVAECAAVVCVCVCISCTYQSVRLEHTSQFVGPGGRRVRGSEPTV
jgi:hypothetical protein